MKKVLALVLALAMAFAVCVPAFAEVTKVDGKWEVKDNVSQTDPVKAQIHTTKELPTGEYAYEISIPADTVIKWGTKYTAFTYDIVKTQLPAGKRLQLQVKSDNLATLGSPRKLTSEATTDTIPYNYSKYDAETNTYTVVDNLSYTTTKEVITDLQPRSFYITIDDWKVALAEYKDTLNFVIDIVDAPVVEP